MDIITGYTGVPHVTAEQDRSINQAIFGSDSYVTVVGQKFSAVLQTNNEIRIRDGVLIHQGCAGIIKKGTYDPVTLTNGSQGLKRVDLIVCRYTKNANTLVESLEWAVIQGESVESGTPVVPEHIEGDIQAGVTISDMPMYKVQFDGINITQIEAVFETISRIPSIKVDGTTLVIKV